MPSLASLAELAREPGLAAVVLDVDGTLAPIVPLPEDARVPPATQAELRRLASRYALVACLSGRTGADARRVVGVDGLVYVGEHGLELDPAAEGWIARLASFADAVSEWPAERKRLTLSYHWRNAVDPVAARAALEALAERAREAGLVPRWGRKVLELRPPLEAHKGTALARLLGDRGLERALYAGDDTTDLDAFAAVTRLPLGIRVAVASAEAPPALLDTADVVVQGPAELLSLLRAL